MSTFWISKYALTGGIEKIEPEGEPQDGLLVYRERGWSRYVHGEGRDWHRTEAGAIARAEVMRKAKIASLQKQIAKLEKLSFNGGANG